MAENSTHTRGPWTYMGGDLFMESPYWGQIRSANWDLIAQQPDGDDRHHDFVLMAAAPDLLEACEEALIDLADMGGLSASTIEDIARAVAKATEV